MQEKDDIDTRKDLESFFLTDPLDYPAEKTRQFLKTKANAMCGHHHQTAEHTERDVNGKIITCWGVGCLSELSPDYNPYSKYNHGFAIITKGVNRNFSVKNYRIHEGSIY